jgi:hypothetical protein
LEFYPDNIADVNIFRVKLSKLSVGDRPQKFSRVCSTMMRYVLAVPVMRPKLALLIAVFGAENCGVLLIFCAVAPT